jgi:nitroreductase
MAHALGLGACWLEAPTTDIRDEYKVRDLLKVPEQYTIFHIIAIGHPAEAPGLRFRLKLDEIAFWNAWGSSK